MKTKYKALALAEIVIVLCSVFLVALPVIGVAADQNQTAQKVSASEVTIAAEDAFILEIYGNANEDECIDMRDYTYTARIICWLEEETTFADANYDGRISVADMTQIGLIVLGRESELTFVDATGDVVTVDKPVKRIISAHSSIAQILRSLDARDMIVGIDSWTMGMGETFFPDLAELPDIGAGFDQDYEAILSLNPDVYMGLEGSVMTPTKEELEEKLLGVTVIMPIKSCLKPEYMEENMRKLGYILDKEKEAEEYIDWRSGYLSTIKSRTDGLSEDEKPRVYIEFIVAYYVVPYFKICDDAGAIDIASDLFGEGEGGYVDPEWVIWQDPDIIVSAKYGRPSGYDEIVCDWGYEVDDPSSIIGWREQIMTRVGWESMTVVKEEKVYITDLYSITEVPNYVIGVSYLAKWFHPDLFEDLDPEAIHQEYLNRFQRIDYDLDEHGVFAYPPIEIDGDLAGIPDKWK